MIYTGPGFLAVVWFSSSSIPPPLLPSVCLTGDTQEDWERETTFWQERGEGWWRSQIILPLESLASINHSRLSVSDCTLAERGGERRGGGSRSAIFSFFLCLWAWNFSIFFISKLCSSHFFSVFCSLYFSTLFSEISPAFWLLHIFQHCLARSKIRIKEG